MPNKLSGIITALVEGLREAKAVTPQQPVSKLQPVPKLIAEEGNFGTVEPIRFPAVVIVAPSEDFDLKNPQDIHTDIRLICYISEARTKETPAKVRRLAHSVLDEVENLQWKFFSGIRPVRLLKADYHYNVKVTNQKHPVSFAYLDYKALYKLEKEIA